jgi:CrcB protein
MKTVLIIALGGALGSVARYGAQMYVLRTYPTLFPLGTFLVNISGCLLIGIFFALAERNNILTPDWRFFLITGLCGGYTTFSTFALENLHLMKGGDLLYAGLYTVGSVVLGVLAVFGGTLLVRLF